MTAAADEHAHLEALDEPALVVEGERVVAANGAAKALLGSAIEGRDFRLALRHPAALQRIADGGRSDVEVVGIGTPDRPWLLSIRPVGQERTLVRLIDRSAARACGISEQRR